MGIGLLLHPVTCCTSLLHPSRPQPPTASLLMVASYPAIPHHSSHVLTKSLSNVGDIFYMIHGQPLPHFKVSAKELFGWTPHFAEPKLWRNHKIVIPTWFLPKVWLATQKSALFYAFSHQTCDADNRRLTRGAAAPAVWQSAAGKQVAPKSHWCSTAG